MRYVKFIKPMRKNESEKLCSTKERNNIIDTAVENAKDNISNIFEQKDRYVKMSLKPDSENSMVVSKIVQHLRCYKP